MIRKGRRGDREGLSRWSSAAAYSATCAFPPPRYHCRPASHVLLYFSHRGQASNAGRQNVLCTAAVMTLLSDIASSSEMPQHCRQTVQDTSEEEMRKKSFLPEETFQ